MRFKFSIQKGSSSDTLLIHLHITQGCFCGTVTELASCKGNCLACKAWNIHPPTLPELGCLTPTRESSVWTLVGGMVAPTWIVAAEAIVGVGQHCEGSTVLGARDWMKDWGEVVGFEWTAVKQGLRHAVSRDVPVL